MPTRDKILIAIVVLISAAILIGKGADSNVLAAGSSQGAFDRSLTVNGPVQLSLENGSGSVTIRRGAADKVEVHAKVRARSWFSDTDDQIRNIEQNPPIEQNGNSIRIYKPEPHDTFNGVSITYDITVPEDTRLSSSTGSGSQLIESVKGPVTVRSGSGSLVVNGIGADVEARTGSGSVKMDKVNGRVDIQTGSGSVDAFDVAGGARIRTGSGSIEFRQTAPGDVDAESGSGSISLDNVTGAAIARCGSGGIRINGEPKGNWEFHSGSGAIDIRTRGNAGFDLYARTNSGRVNIGSPITVEGGQLNPREVRGKVRGGGTTLEAVTGSGSIRIE
ncbi:MAG TPA: DUF4097 family beta strand repeat-containing protein [Terriglobales bacterium]|nr:DUF4097 family beta strand repeat-containing protein [Terriglobales bacterium]